MIEIALVQRDLCIPGFAGNYSHTIVKKHKPVIETGKSSGTMIIDKNRRGNRSRHGGCLDPKAAGAYQCDQKYY